MSTYSSFSLTWVDANSTFYKPKICEGSHWGSFCDQRRLALKGQQWTLVPESAGPILFLHTPQIPHLGITALVEPRGQWPSRKKAEPWCVIRLLPCSRVVPSMESNFPGE